MALRSDVAARVKQQVLAEFLCMPDLATSGCRRLPCEEPVHAGIASSNQLAGLYLCVDGGPGVQVEFYFSDSNLPRDPFLCGKVEEDPEASTNSP